MTDGTTSTAPNAHPAPAPELSVVIPMYNEAQRIGPTLAAVRTGLATVGLTAEIVLVDDGSTDQTVAAVTPELHDDPRGAIERTALVKLPENRGKGAAVRAGLAAARAPKRLMMDADGSNTVEDVRTLLAEMDRTDAGLAVGSRAMPGVRIKAKATRRAAGLAFRAALRSFGVSGIRDTQCGFKLYTKAAADLVCELGTEDRFAFDIEHILLCRKAGLHIVEVGVPWEHRDGSKVSVVSDGLKMVAATRLISKRVRQLDLSPRPPARTDPPREPALVESRQTTPAVAERAI
ncbi:MAG: glycosyltransferase [Planctomycetota bacterium]